MIKFSLKLEDILDNQEFERFQNQWSSFKQKEEISSPGEVHMGNPLISKVFQFDNKPIFRARVFQGRNKLRKINPYYNAPFYMMPFWHLVHYWMTGEQFYHACMEKVRPNNNSCFVRDLPGDTKIDKPVFWPSKVQGHVSVIGLHQILRGSWESGKAIEGFTVYFYDDKKNENHGYMSSACIMQKRSFVGAYNNLLEQKEGAKERMLRLIDNQQAQHEDLSIKRKDLIISAGELKNLIIKGEIPSREYIDNFFSLYDLNHTEKTVLISA